MSEARLLSLVAVGFVTLCTAAQAAELPPGPNRDVVAQTCGTCHSLDMVADARGYSRDAWNDTIDEMIGYGLKVTPDDRAKILDYLITALGLPPPKPPAP